MQQSNVKFCVELQKFDLSFPLFYGLANHQPLSPNAAHATRDHGEIKAAAIKPISS